MTAYRIVTDHEELENVGQLSHHEIDNVVIETGWVIVTGSVGSLPPGARKIVAGSGVTISDGGPGGNLVISATGGGGGTSTISWMEKPSGSNDGINQQFVLAYTPSPPASLMFFVNGILQEQGNNSDYILLGNVVQLLYVPKSGSNLWATYPY